MGCSKSRNDIVLFPLGLLFFSLGLCKIPEKQKNPEYSILTNRNSYWRHGKILIGLKSEQDGTLKAATDNIDMDYQSDMAWDAHEEKMVAHGFPEYDKTAVERLLKMNPTVVCSGGHMRLQVKDADSKPGALLFVDRGHLPPLSLSKLPKSCGYKVRSTHHNFDMIAPYDGCFVLVTELCYVLPLRWFGLPVQLSCPVGLTSTTADSDPTPMVTCHRGGMVIKTEWTSALSDIKVNLMNKWEPLTKASAICNGAVTHSEGMITMSFLYPSPCVEKKNGMYIVKISGDVDIEISCPPTPLAPPGFPQFVGQFGVTPAPNQHAKTTLHAPQFDMPQTPGHTGNQINSLDNQQSAQHVDHGLGQSFYLPPVLYGDFGHVSITHSDLSSMNVFNQEPGLQLENPSLEMSPFEDPWLYWPPYLPLEPVKPELPPKPNGPLKPEGSPTYPCLYHTTENPEVMTTAGPPATVPQHYQLHGPYYHPYLIPYLPHSTPTPSIQKPQDPSISGLGTAVVFPKHPHPNIKQPVECLQYCQVGLLDCCPQIAIYQHHYHFVPQQQNGKFQSPVYPQPGQPTVSRPHSLHVLSQGAQVAPAPPNHPTVTKAPFSPHFYQLGEHQGRQTYHRPQEGSPAALPGNKPLEQTASLPPFFGPNANFPHDFDMNHWNPQVQPGGPSARAPSHSHYSHFFNSDRGSHLYDPYKVPSSHQSDGPSLSMQSPNPLSRIHQYASQLANHANHEKESVLIFGNPQNAQLGLYGSGEEHISNHQPDSLSKTQSEYVLLQESPPGRDSRDSVQPLHYSQVVQNKYFANNFPEEVLNLKESEDSRSLDGEDLGNAGQTTGETPGPRPQSSSTGSTSGRLFRDPVSHQFFKYPQRLVSPFDRQRTLQQDISQ